MAQTGYERLKAYRARKKAEKAADAAPVESPPPVPAWTIEDAKLVARCKRVARGEWLDLCELAERLMRR